MSYTWKEEVFARWDDLREEIGCKDWRSERSRGEIFAGYERRGRTVARRGTPTLQCFLGCVWIDVDARVDRGWLGYRTTAAKAP